MTERRRSEIEAEALKTECRGCGKAFYLTGDDDVKGFCTLLQIRACDSGGIYAVYVVCPHCRLKHDLI